MDKATKVFEKMAFWPVEIVDPPKSKKEYKQFGGYAKEWVNRAASGFVGGVGGGVIGGAGGATIGGLIGLALRKPREGAALGAAIGASTVGTAGGISAGYQSLRKSEQAAGFKDKTDVGRFIGRGVGSMVGKGVIPIIGGPVGDYLVSREMQKKSQFAGLMKALKPMAKKVLTKSKKFGQGYAKNVSKDFGTLASSEAGRAAKRKALVGLAGRVGLPGYVAGDILT